LRDLGDRTLETTSEGKEVYAVASLLWTILVVLVVLWLFGLVANVGGSLIHILLVLALIILLYNLLVGRRTI
jgi:hypothetical protein